MQIESQTSSPDKQVKTKLCLPQRNFKQTQSSKHLYTIMEDPNSLAVAWNVHSLYAYAHKVPWVPHHSCAHLQARLKEALVRFESEAKVNQDLQACGKALCEMQLLLSMIIVGCGFAKSFSDLFDEVCVCLLC